MRLAIDVMGGDHAPDAVLKGAIQALDSLDSDDQIVLVGPRKAIEETLEERGVSDTRLIIEAAPDTIAMDESPVEAVRSKKDSSIVRMALLGSARCNPPVDAVFSAGNTGACVSAATMYMRRLPGVHRPGIAVTMPSFHGPMVLCDAGANPEPRPVHLAQYAVMAEVYASHVLGIKNPRIAQVNIGAERAKGTGLIRQVRDLLEQMPGLNYIGYIEGRDMFEGATDVVVTDGFVGNSMLKMAEGLAKALMQAIADEVFAYDADLALKFQPVAERLFKQSDHEEYGGAPLLGVNGVCVIGHGSSSAKAVRSAIGSAKRIVNTQVNKAIVERLAEVAPAIEPETPASPLRETA